MACKDLSVAVLASEFRKTFKRSPTALFFGGGRLWAFGKFFLEQAVGKLAS